MTQYLFTIRPADYAAAVRALATEGMYLTPGVDGQQAVTCETTDPEAAAERARTALETHRVMVWEVTS